MDDRRLVEDLIRFWTVQDVEQTLALMSDDVVYRHFVSPTATPFGGETRGQSEMRRVLYGILAQLDYIVYQPTLLDVADGIARVHVHFTFLHRATGEELTGSKRMILRLAGGKVVAIDEHNDAGMVEAFYRLVQTLPQRANDCMIPQTPSREARAAGASRATLQAKPDRA
jgi:ketosteroid isomerase-like protein